MVLAFQHMLKYIPGGGKRTVGNNPFYLQRKLQTACHKHCGCPHGRSVKPNLTVTAKALLHIFDPEKRILPVQASESDVSPFAVPMGPFIHQKHLISPGQIIVGQPYVVTHAFAGIAVKTEHKFFAPLPRKIRSVEFQPVTGCNVHILPFLFQHPLFHLFKLRHVKIPVGACHIHSSLGCGFLPKHGPSEKVRRNPIFPCSGRRSCSQ